jgi:hypothetical protein
MAGISGKLSQVKYMKGASRRDRRSQVNGATRVSKRAYSRAVRRAGKRSSSEA